MFITLIRFNLKKRRLAYYKTALSVVASRYYRIFFPICRISFDTHNILNGKLAILLVLDTYRVYI